MSALDARWIFAPVLVQVALVLLMYVRLQVVKKRALVNGVVDEARRALHEDAWPDSVRQVNNNIRNQFEVPVLFYVLVSTLYALGAVDAVAHAAAWAFALSRCAHAYVHAGSNYVPARRRVFTFGVIMLMVLLALCARGLA